MAVRHAEVMLIHVLASIVIVPLVEKDIYYSYKRSSSNISFIDIPDNFKVSFLPENAQYEDGDFGFSINYKVEDNKIVVYQRVEINTLQLRTEQFGSWNKMIKGLFIKA